MPIMRQLCIGKYFLKSIIFNNEVLYLKVTYKAELLLELILI